MKWKNTDTGEYTEETGALKPPKIEACFNENIAILTGGPSLDNCWNDGMYSLFHTVWAINMVGKRFYHDYVYYLDTPNRIFGEAGVKQWPKTLKGYRDRKTVPIDKECGITFPACFDYVMRTSRISTRVYLFGWDCDGVGIVDGKAWNDRDGDLKSQGDRAKECEKRLMKKYWNADKVAGVSGAMREWAEKELGFNATPINRFSKPDPPPRTPGEKEKLEELRG